MKVKAGVKITKIFHSFILDMTYFAKLVYNFTYYYKSGVQLDGIISTDEFLLLCACLFKMKFFNDYAIVI